MTTRKLLICLASFMIIWSCQKEESKVDDYQLSQKKTTTPPWSSAANSNNPYEYLETGIYHNECLDYFKNSRSNYSTEQLWIDDLHQIGLDYFCTVSDLTYCNAQLTVTNLEAIDDLALSTEQFNTAIGTLATGTQTRVWELLGFYTQYNMTNYSGFKQAVVLFETNVDAEQTITDSDKKMLLLAAQVARYSALYWKEQIENNFSGWTFSALSDIEWDETSSYDVRGVMAGFIEGQSTSNSLEMATEGGPIASMAKGTRSNLLDD